MFAQLPKPSALLRASRQAKKLACCTGGIMARRRPRCIKTAWLFRQHSKTKRLDRTLVQSAANGRKEPRTTEAATRTNVRSGESSKMSLETSAHTGHWLGLASLHRNFLIAVFGTSCRIKAATLIYADNRGPFCQSPRNPASNGIRSNWPPISMMFRKLPLWVIVVTGVSAGQGTTPITCLTSTVSPREMAPGAVK
jgi:hypothetical protein